METEGEEEREWDGERRREKGREGRDKQISTEYGDWRDG